MRKRKAFSNDVYAQAKSMQAEGHLDQDIQDYFVRSGQLTEWDAQVLLHEISDDNPEKSFQRRNYRRNWVIIITCNTIGLLLTIPNLIYLYSFRNVELFQIRPVALAVLIFLGGCVFLEKGIAELISGTKPR